MASEYKIHRPYVLAALPRPLDHTDGRILAREVYGREGKKRTELAVGIDGETASIYDVPASRLITSYPIPPQESFTCAPYSVRIRQPGSNEILRSTFIATKDGASCKITLFKDVVHADGKTTSTTTSQTLRTSPVKYIASSRTAAQSPSQSADVTAVCENGEIACLSGDSLSVLWTASSKSAVQDVITGTIEKFEVEYLSSATLTDFRDGMFKDRSEIFSALPKGLDFDPLLLIMIAKSVSGVQTSRHLLVLAALPGDSNKSARSQNLIPLDVTPIVSSSAKGGSMSYQVDVQSGLLLEFSAGSASTYDISGVIPKHRSTIQVEDAKSFLRLSRPFLLTASLGSVSLFNYQHRSIHAKAPLDLSELPSENQLPVSCQLVTFMRSQELVVALIDNVLVSIHVEPPKAHGKRRRTGLLIDSIGRGAPLELGPKKQKCEQRPMEFATHVPGTITEAYLKQYNEDLQTADELLSQNRLADWEDLLRQKLHMKVREEAAANMDGALVKAAAADAQESPEWDWLTETPYPSVDRRWIMYAISQVFSVETASSDELPPKLRLVLPDSNVTTYLVVAGHLTLSNLTSAFRVDLDTEAVKSKSLASSLLDCITDADPSMTLLLNYLQATKLGEVELLLAIRTLMRSMDLISDTQKLNGTKLLTNEAHDGNDKYEMDLDDLEREIAVTEHYLGDDSSSRSRGLTLAFTKLWRVPVASTVKALRSTIQTEEVLAFIQLLRIELVRGAWTSLYIDPSRFEGENNEPPPDGVITLIADLLGRCLDAIGAGGWLFNDAMAWADKGEAGNFLTALKLEVTAALEGIEDAVYLNGVIGEAVRFGLVASKRSVSRQTWNSDKPISMQVEGRESRLLPLGLKTKLLPTKEKIVSGGEIVQRSMRETGHLISQHVEVYSLEKIAV
ncbi:hypothetical protein HIM_08550 [Hirsutella minnesotensis 3608]|uniref:Utp8 beta-propeller domain-containing protein n=1 Tax=Hirsutella minnesotensis 3608 TaxID=1043627 RepID=A0A0F7ZMI8_9HYPO|nr:hypothetical protein HIM_08550 [Hirsutella minnesotensis 3608]